jgi:hypothetical protein
MKYSYFFGAALGAALLSSPAAAQPDHGRMDRDRTITHRDISRDSGMRMHDRDRLRDSDDRLDRDRDRDRFRASDERVNRDFGRRCRSMSRHRLMMMHSRCRPMRHRHHHHDM